MATPRTPDDDRERFKREHDEEKSRAGQSGKRGAAADDDNDRQRFERETDPKERDRLLEEKPFDFIERTRPEDPTGDRRQLTRDNVNPNIPSVSPEDVGPPHQRILNPGGIVDPHTLGMPQATGGPEPRVEGPDPAEPKAVAGGKEAPPLPDATPDQLAARYVSANEPWGSNVGTGTETGEGGGEGEGSTPILTNIDPDSAPVDPNLDLALTVTGEGFTADCVVLFDDEEVTTVLVNSTTLTASVPSATEPGVVDVEVARGEDLSEVLTFEWLAAAGGTRAKREPQKPKPKKAEPPSKRAKTKQKGRR